MAMTAGEANGRASVFDRPRPGPSRAYLLALDPDLGAGLDPEQLGAARRELVARVAVLPEGEWSPRMRGSTAALGLLVAGGLVVRETRFGANCSAELISPGDVIRPWQEDDGALYPPSMSWHVAAPARVAVLDPALTAALAKWPAVLAEVFGRGLRRTRSQAVQRAIAQVRRLDVRTLLYLWHVGERIGRVTPAGIVLRLPLTHERLAGLVGAHRPSVTAALNSLERDGLILRDHDHQLVLTPKSRALVERHAERRREGAP